MDHPDLLLIANEIMNYQDATGLLNEHLFSIFVITVFLNPQR